jgi:hypothetical protein
MVWAGKPLMRVAVGWAAAVSGAGACGDGLGSGDEMMDWAAVVRST